MQKKIINKNNFEQSIEFIYPKTGKNLQNLPLVIYIGGTAWLGYSPFIYRIADLWNKRIIYKLVNEGYSCAIIRYRGKFFNPLPNYFMIIISVLILITNINFGVLTIILFIFWKKKSKTVPTIFEMENDLIKNINSCLLYSNNFIKQEINTNGEIILIAYSAGSHILLSALTKINKNLNNIDLIKGIIIISGVLNIPKKKELKFGLINKMTKLFLNTIFIEDTDNIFCPSKNFLIFKNIPFLIIKSKREFLNIPIIEKVASKFFKLDTFINNINIKNVYSVNSNHWLILTNKTVLDKIKNFINK